MYFPNNRKYHKKVATGDNVLLYFPDKKKK